MSSENLQETLYNKKIDVMDILNINDASKYKGRTNVIVTGCTGQDGSHMVDYLLKNTDMTIFGGVRRLSVYNHNNIKHINNDRFHLINFDLTDSHAISRIVEVLNPDYFINFAAQSFVASSWDFARQTWQTNSTAVLDCLEAIRQYAPNCRFYNAGCYDLKTRICTSNGIKSFDEVKEGDLVFSLNPTNLNIELKPILKKIYKKYTGDMYHFKGIGKDILVTEDHKMIYQNVKSNTLTFKDAKSCSEMSRFMFPRGNWVGRNQNSKNENFDDVFDLRSYIPNKEYFIKEEITSIQTEDLFYLIGLYVGDGSCDLNEKIIDAIPKSVIYENRNSDGTFKNNDSLPLITKKVRTYEFPRIQLFIPESDKSIESVKTTLDRCKLTWTRNGDTSIYFKSWALYNIFSECGHTSLSKTIPKWCLNADPKYLKRLLQGILDSDGDSNKVVDTISYQLVQDLIELGIKVGRGIYFYKRNARTSRLKDGRIIKGNYPSYTVYLRKNNTFHNKTINTKIYKCNNCVKKIKYDDYVWCLEVQDNHNFLIERGGSINFCGNSSEEFGNVEYSPQDELHPLRPRSPYGSSKAAARQLVKVYRESYNLYAVQGWLFNHEGERRGEEFVTRKITSNVARITEELKKGKTVIPLELGNVEARRDWSYAPDFMDGVWRMLNQEVYSKYVQEPITELSGIPIINPKTMPFKWIIPRLKDFVLASGENHTIKEFVEESFAIAGIKGKWIGKDLDEQFIIGASYANNLKVLVNINPQFYRPAEVDTLLGNSDLARKELGWSPKTNFKELVKIMTESELNKKLT